MTDEPKQDRGYLPPVGQINELDHVGAWLYMSQLALEDKQLLSAFVPLADVGIAVFNWGDVEYDGQTFQPPTRIDTLRVNQIQNDTIAVTKATFREPVAFELVCSDTGPYAPCYWAGPASLPMNQPVTDELGQPLTDPLSGQPAMQPVDLVAQWGLQPSQLGPSPEVDEFDWPTGQMMRIQPIDQLQAMQIEQQLEAMGLPSEWLCHADKRTVSDIYQTYFDGVWSDPKFGGQQWATRFGLDTNTQGWNTAMYEWRADVGDVIVPLSIKQCYLDGQHVFIGKMQHVMADFAFDVTYAKQQFPWISKEIDANKQKSGGVPVSVDGNTMWGQRDNKNFQRDIVIMRIGWFRDQPMPLTEDEAINGGHVQQAVLDTGSVGAAPAVSEGGLVSAPNQDPAMASGADSPPSLPNGPIPFQLSDGTQVKAPIKGQPLDPNWPMRVVLRRCIAIGGKIVSDMVEDHWDIPILHLVCFPVTNTPYGTGVPFKCWQIQKSRTTVVTSMKEAGEFVGHPMIAGPTDAIESMGETADGIFARPNAVIKLDPTYLANKTIDQVISILSPPPLPPSVVQVEEAMERIQTQLSGNVAPLKGESENPDDSGRKTQALQEAATNQINTGEDTEGCLQRLAMLMQHAHLHFARVEDVMKYYRKLPRAVMEAIHMDIAPSLHWEVRVSTANGGGLLKVRKRQQAVMDNQTVDPLSGEPVLDVETTRQECGYDAQEIRDRLKAQRMEFQPAGSNGDPEEKNSESSSNGKKSKNNGNGKRISDQGGYNG